MPFAHEHAARLRDPDSFVRIVQLWAKESEGIRALGGPLKSDPDGGTVEQTIRFKDSMWTVAEAKAWLKEHDYKVILFEEATGEEEGQATVVLDIKAAGRNPRITGVAYTGGQMKLPGWAYPVVVDLEGLEIPDTVPLLVNHENRTGSRIGIIRARIEGTRIIFGGEIISSSNVAQGVIEQAQAGADWQLSIGAEVKESILVRDSASVNGQTHRGPFYHVRKAVLREVSVLPVAADAETRLRLAAAFYLIGGQGMKLEKEFKEWVEAKGFSADELTEDQVKNLKAMYEAEKAAAEVQKQAKGKQKAAKDPKTVQAAGDVQPQGQDEPPTPEMLATKAIEDLRAQYKAEADRVAAIRKACDGKHADIEAKAIGEGWTAEKAELEVLRASRPQAPQIIGSPEKAVTPLIIEAALRLGGSEGHEVVEKAYDAKVLEAAHGFRHIGLKELIAICCALDGRPRPRLGASDDDYIEAAFSTASLSGIMGAAANKIALDAYKAVEVVAPKVCAVLSANDFKTHTMYRMTGDMVPKEVGEDGELKHVELGESSGTYRVSTYGNMLTVTRKMIINDDLQMLTQLPKMFGRGSALLIERLFFTLLLANTGNFFHANNSNLITAVLASAGLSTAVQTIRKMKDADGHPILVNPKYLLVPPELETTAQELYVSTNLASGTAAKVPDKNIHANKYQPVISPYISDSGFTGYSSTQWYLFGDPADIGAFGIAYLKGNQTPTFEAVSLANNILGKGWRGYFDIGVCQMEKQGAVKSTGAG